MPEQEGSEEKTGWSSANSMGALQGEAVGETKAFKSTYPVTGEKWVNADTGEPVGIVAGVEGVAQNGYVLVRYPNTDEVRRVQPGHFGSDQRYQRPGVSSDLS
jgi:hypothetical protein